MATFSEKIDKQIGDINMILESDSHPGMYIYDFMSGQQKPIEKVKPAAFGVILGAVWSVK